MTTGAHWPLWKPYCGLYQQLAARQAISLVDKLVQPTIGMESGANGYLSMVSQSLSLLSSLGRGSRAVALKSGFLIIIMFLVV
jgi:hypothetical protein